MNKKRLMGSLPCTELFIFFFHHISKAGSQHKDSKHKKEVLAWINLHLKLTDFSQHPLLVSRAIISFLLHSFQIAAILGPF